MTNLIYVVKKLITMVISQEWILPHKKSKFTFQSTISLKYKKKRWTHKKEPLSSSLSSFKNRQPSSPFLPPLLLFFFSNLALLFVLFVSHSKPKLHHHHLTQKGNKKPPLLTLKAAAIEGARREIVVACLLWRSLKLQEDYIELIFSIRSEVAS